MLSRSLWESAIELQSYMQSQNFDFALLVALQSSGGESLALRTTSQGSLTTCSAEDLVILKSFASRPRDWIDVEKTIVRQSKKLNLDLIREELEVLAGLKEEPEILDHLENLFRKYRP